MEMVNSNDFAKLKWDLDTGELKVDGTSIEKLIGEAFTNQYKSRKEVRKKMEITQWASRTPSIDRVIFNGSATIVFWNDGEKTVVKRSEGEADDREKAILTAFALKMLGGKPELNKIMRKAFKDKEPKRYHWTDICKVRFYKPDKKLEDFMNDVKKNFGMFGYISLGKLRDLVAYHDILKNGPAPFEIPKFDWTHTDARLCWTNPKDFGVGKEYDKEKKCWYYHIYIRRSPEPKPYPDDGKGEEE